MCQLDPPPFLYYLCCDMKDKKMALSEMTLDELWELFPIVLSPHQSQWREWAYEEISALNALLSEYKPYINHIGSTAVPGIWAKPIVDILVELLPETVLDQVRMLLEQSGYICMSASDSRLSFNKGYTSDGYAERVFHVHLRRSGDNDEIYFRDYLIAHPDAAREYEKLKRSLLPKYKHDRDGYTAAKTDFVRLITELAKAEITQPRKR